MRLISEEEYKAFKNAISQVPRDSNKEEAIEKIISNI